MEADIRGRRSSRLARERDELVSNSNRSQHGREFHLHSAGLFLGTSDFPGCVDMGWSTLGDFCINEEKFIGCSYYRNSIGIWVSDISQLVPHGDGSEGKNESMVKRFRVLDDQSSERVGSGSRGSSSPDHETKEIKNIYVACIFGTGKGGLDVEERLGNA